MRALKSKIGDGGLPAAIANTFLTPEQRGERMGDILVHLFMPAFRRSRKFRRNATYSCS